MAAGVVISLIGMVVNFFHTRHLHKQKFRQDFELQEFRDVLKTPINDVWRKFEVVAEKIQAILDTNVNCQQRALEAANLQQELYGRAYDDLYAVMVKANATKFVGGSDWLELIEDQFDQIVNGFDKLANPSNSEERQREGGKEILLGIQQTKAILQSRIDGEASRIIDGKKAS